MNFFSHVCYMPHAAFRNMILFVSRVQTSICRIVPCQLSATACSPPSICRRPVLIRYGTEMTKMEAK